MPWESRGFDLCGGRNYEPIVMQYRSLHAGGGGKVPLPPSPHALSQRERGVSRGWGEGTPHPACLRVKLAEFNYGF